MKMHGAALACVIAAAVGIPGAAQVADPPCWVAGDAANLASELTADASDLEVQKVLRYLKIGTERCRDPQVLADAWYYQGLLERHIDKNSLVAGLHIERGKGGQAYKEKWPLFGTKPSVAPPEKKAIGEKWAIVIGIGKFKNNVPELHYTAKDASDFAGLLKDPEVGRFKPENVTLLMNEQATVEGIRTAIGNLRDKAKPEDLVVVYISSHGSPRGRDPHGVSYVVAYNTDISGPDKLYATGLSMSDLVNMLNRDVQVQRLALFLDTCYSGAAAPGSVEPGSRSLLPTSAMGGSSFSGGLTNFTAAGWAVVTASRGDQKSWESAELKQGYFTYFLLEGLRASKGRANMEELFAGLRGKVAERVKADRMADQIPVMSVGSEGGKLVLGAASGSVNVAIGSNSNRTTYWR